MARTARKAPERRAMPSRRAAPLFLVACSLSLLFYLIQHSAAFRAIADWLSGR